VTLHNFHCSDELWEKFLASIEGVYENASHALREIMKQHINARLQTSLETEQSTVTNIHQNKPVFLGSSRVARRENKEEDRAR